MKKPETSSALDSYSSGGIMGCDLVMSRNGAPASRAHSSGGQGSEFRDGACRPGVEYNSKSCSYTQDRGPNRVNRQCYVCVHTCSEGMDCLRPSNFVNPFWSRFLLTF